MHLVDPEICQTVSRYLYFKCWRLVSYQGASEPPIACIFYSRFLYLLLLLPVPLRSGCLPASHLLFSCLPPLFSRAPTLLSPPTINETDLLHFFAVEVFSSYLIANYLLLIISDISDYGRKIFWQYNIRRLPNCWGNLKY